jgi:ATP-dependent DNA ligase
MRHHPIRSSSPRRWKARPETLGAIDDWLLEWKWDGIRLQLIRRSGDIALWSRGEERLDGRFPEIEAALATLPRDAVVDGELLAWRDGEQPLPFTALQTRIQRRKPGAKTLADTPVRVLAYDLLELDGEDLRARRWPSAAHCWRPCLRRMATRGSRCRRASRPSPGRMPPRCAKAAARAASKD